MLDVNDDGIKLDGIKRTEEDCCARRTRNSPGRFVLHAIDFGAKRSIGNMCVPTVCLADVKVDAVEKRVFCLEEGRWGTLTT